ncbi:sensor histidine kinase [Imhoffiella purpurea]|uniref:histidine kinase n=1 Tax=Imhoffiella purpurea TaxID=1249627 RepID=W9VVH5_9GAMM|nr:ATP-binding protein [Imhoffiella purpurea]EXJ14405.1 Sensory box histidine kinase [Imhoffiella purpurea]
MDQLDESRSSGKWRQTLLFATLIWIPLIAVLTLLMATFHAKDMEHLRRLVGTEQHAVITEAALVLTNNLDWVHRDLEYLSRRPDLDRFLTSGGENRHRELTRDLASFMETRHGIYDQLRYLDASGLEVVRVDNGSGKTRIATEAELQDKSDRYYFHDAWASPLGTIYLSPFDLNVEHGVIEIPYKPMLRCATKVGDRTGVAKAVLILNYLGQPLIGRLQALAKDSDISLWLLNQDSYWLLGDRPEQAWGFMFPDGRDRTLAKRDPALWRTIEAGTRDGHPLHARFDEGLLSAARFEPTRKLSDRNPATANHVLQSPSYWILVSWVPKEDLALQARPLTQRHVIIWITLGILLAMLSVGIAHLSVKRRQSIETMDKALQRLAVANHGLNSANRELESFSYSVSHDLRAPLRTLDGFSNMLLKGYADKLDDKGQDYLQRMRTAAQRMSRLIDDMLALSRITRAELKREPLDLGAMAEEILDELAESDPERHLEVRIQPELHTSGDRRLVHIAMQNLLANAWKFTSRTGAPRIEVGRDDTDRPPSFFVRDNGAGFDMAYADKLFGAFQRLHHASDFPGTGIGLATVQRVVHKHGGRIWGQGAIDQGAVFHFTLSPQAIHES